MRMRFLVHTGTGESYECLLGISVSVTDSVVIGANNYQELIARTRGSNSRRFISELRDKDSCHPSGGQTHCQCCRFSDLLSMTPYLAALTRHRRPESANNNSAKQKWRRQPA